MKTNKTTIQLTKINNPYPLEIFMDKFLMLRKARKIGDIEIINNTQLGRLNQWKNDGCIDFIVL